MERPPHQLWDIVHENAVPQQSGIGQPVEKFLDVESNDGVSVRRQPLGELLMRAPEAQIISEKEHACFWMPRPGDVGIEIKWLLPQLRITRSIG